MRVWWLRTRMMAAGAAPHLCLAVGVTPRALLVAAVAPHLGLEPGGLGPESGRVDGVDAASGDSLSLMVTYRSRVIVSPPSIPPSLPAAPTLRSPLSTWSCAPRSPS